MVEAQDATRRLPRWPLILIALPAAVAVWSGWVGLGQLCGFGVVHPLPGIWDSATINTAITLPIGVEAYGAYALGAWLTPGTAERARKFARRSAISALALGMLGQVAYHLLAAVHATSAPWPVTMFVSCLPVIALALGTALAHLLREPGEDPLSVGEAAETVADSVPEETAENRPSVPESGPVDVPADVPQDGPEGVPAVVPADVPDTAPVACLRPRLATPRSTPKRTPDPAWVFAADLGAGRVPSLRSVKERCHVGTDRAREIQSELRARLEVSEAA